MYNVNNKDLGALSITNNRTVTPSARKKVLLRSTAILFFFFSTHQPAICSASSLHADSSLFLMSRTVISKLDSNCSFKHTWKSSTWTAVEGENSHEGPRCSVWWCCTLSKLSEESSGCNITGKYLTTSKLSSSLWYNCVEHLNWY